MKIMEEKLTKEIKSQVYEGFSEHALSSVGSDGNMEDITFVAREGDTLIGIVHGQTFWGALHVKYLYVAPNHREKGIGKILMSRVLEKGKSKGSKFAFVETMSFQAVDFYKRLNFKEDFCRSGYDENTSFHYLRRDL